MTKRDRLNDSSMLQRRISAKTMKIDVNQGSARRGLAGGARKERGNGGGKKGGQKEERKGKKKKRKRQKN